MAILMIKRIVVLKLNGIRKIIGQMDVPADAVFTSALETADFHTVEFVENRPTYILYKEIDTCQDSTL